MFTSGQHPLLKNYKDEGACTEWKPIVYEAFTGLPRQGPGSDESTAKAISMLDFEKEKELAILDVGCGTGSHTIMLAEQFPNAQIMAIDTNEANLATLKTNLEQKQLNGRISVKHASMFDMGFQRESFDLIWAEGSIYIIGFQKGLETWRPFLKQGGYIVCSELSWLHEHPSEASKQFWNEGYPEIDTVANKTRHITRLKYHFQFSFTLPKKDWINEYYSPLENNLQQMKQTYQNTPEAWTVIEMIEQEISLYHHHSDDYSYVFYGMRKS